MVYEWKEEQRLVPSLQSGLVFQILLQENFTLQHISIIPVSFHFF